MKHQLLKQFAGVSLSFFCRFIDQIFHKMNGAIKYKRLDPMDLRLMHSDKIDPNKPRIDVRDPIHGAASHSLPAADQHPVNPNTM